MLPSAAWRNRIIGYGEEAPDQLLANDKNWRIHPKAQQDALAGVLKEVGIVQNIIVNSRSGKVVDGHLRAALAISANQPTVPVTYVDLDEAEEAKILATIDPLSAMAATDTDLLMALLSEVETGDAALQALLDKIGGVAPETDFPALSDGDKQPFQQMTFTLHDEQAEQVRRAMDAAKSMGPFVGSPNENSNGNALARVCETFLTAHANG